MDLRCRSSLTRFARHGAGVSDEGDGPLAGESATTPLLAGASAAASESPPSRAAMQQSLRRFQEAYDYDERWLETLWAAMEPSATTTTAKAAAHDLTLNFSSVESYLMALQVLFGTAMMATVSVLGPVLLMPSGMDAKTPLRIVISTALVGACLLVKSALTAPSVALTELYRVLRNAAPLYLGSLVVEGLAHVGCGETAHVLGPRRSALLHLAALLLVLSSCARAAFPTLRLDGATATSLLSLVVIGVLPMRLATEAGPFGDQHVLTPLESMTRVGRATVFALVYTAFAIAGAPRHVYDAHVPLQTLRALGASAWTLCVPPAALLLGPVLVCLLAHRRVALHDAEPATIQGHPPSHRAGKRVPTRADSDIENSSSDETEGMLSKSSGRNPHASLSADRKSHLLKLLNGGDTTGVSTAAVTQH